MALTMLKDFKGLDKDFFQLLIHHLPSDFLESVGLDSTGSILGSGCLADSFTAGEIGSLLTGVSAGIPLRGTAGSCVSSLFVVSGRMGHFSGSLTVRT